MLDSFVTEYRRYRILAEKALSQVSDEELNQVPAPEANSISMLVRHVSGNLISRFTDFLGSDGEKPWRNRDDEFVERTFSRAETEAMWQQGWDLLESTLRGLSESDLNRTVRIRGQELTVHDALARALAHAAYHAGQIVLLARMAHTGDWESLSIPKRASHAPTERPAGGQGGG